MDIPIRQMPGVTNESASIFTNIGYETSSIIFGVFLLNKKDIDEMDRILRSLVPIMTQNERTDFINYLAEWGDNI